MMGSFASLKCCGTASYKFQQRHMQGLWEAAQCLSLGSVESSHGLCCWAGLGGGLTCQLIDPRGVKLRKPMN